MHGCMGVCICAILDVSVMHLLLLFSPFPLSWTVCVHTNISMRIFKVCEYVAMQSKLLLCIAQLLSVRVLIYCNTLL